MTGIYAIDFGTSNTVVTRWNSGSQAAEVVMLPELSQRLGQNPPMIPSLIYVQDAAHGSVLVGQAVRDRGLDVSSDSRFFSNVKRGIGASAQGFLPTLDHHPLSFEQLGEWFLKAIIQAIQARDPELHSLVMTVPVDSFEVYRNWLGNVAQTLDIDHVRMIDEPTAAALSYELGDRPTLLVIDFGGGTLDFSLVQRTTPQSNTPAAKPLGFILKWGEKNMAVAETQKSSAAKVLAKAGQNLGGADIDHWLADYFSAAQNLPITPLTLRLIEKLKIELSTQTTATEAFFNDETLESYELSLGRDRFNALLRERGFFDVLNESLALVLRQGRQQGIEPDDIDAVILVGGTAQIPALQDWIREHFPSDKVRTDNPFGAIAQGALQLSQGVDLKDFLYHGYGIRYWNPREKRHGWHAIIPEGQPYPMERPVELVLGASVDNQPSIELVVGEMGTAKSVTEVYFDGDRLITRTRTSQDAVVQPLNDTEGARSLATLEPPGFPGSDRIKLLFWVDSDRFLRVTVEDLLTNETVLNNRVIVQLT